MREVHCTFLRAAGEPGAPLEAERLLDLLEAARGEVEPRGGRLTAISDSGFGAIFERADLALAAAWAMQWKLAEVEAGTTPSLGIGLATGHARAVSLHDGWGYLGPAVDQSLELVRRANAGAILLTAQTLRDLDLEALFEGVEDSQRPWEEWFGSEQQLALSPSASPISVHAFLWRQPPVYGTSSALRWPAGQRRRGVAADDHPGPSSESLRRPGRVGRLEAERGCGEISYTSESGDEDRVYFHRSNVVGNSPTSVGDRVQFLLASDRIGRPQAESVVVVGARLTGSVLHHQPGHLATIAMRDLQGNRIDFSVGPHGLPAALGVGAAVLFTVATSPLGLLATAVAPTERTGEHDQPGAEPLVIGGVGEGVVETFAPERGSGTIRCDGNQVFAHFSEVLTPDRCLQPGQRVRFTTAIGRDRSYRAIEIEPLG